MKKLFNITIFLLASFNLLSQANQVIPPSPNAANLGKYVEVPVSLYTGRPQMNVPIWTIEEGSINLPISVDYGFGGVRVSEIASWVGLGWTLNAGGLVSRSQIGKQDEGTGGFLNSGAPLNPPPSGSQNAYLENLKAHADGILDNQPDVFYYNFAGHSGKFVFDKNGTIYSIPRKNIKIEKGNTYSFNAQTFYSGWKITTEDGVVYEFNKSEESESSTMRKKRPEDNFVIVSANGSVNAWYLTRIISPQGDEIKFNYVKNTSGYTSDFISSIVKHISVNGGGCPESELPSGLTKIEQKVYGQRLSSIEWSGGKILFNAHSVKRADLNGDYALDNIVVQDYNGRVVRKFAFSYKILSGTSMLDYATTSSNATSYPQRRLMLMGVKELDAAGTAKNAGYTFKYHTDKGLPNRSYLNTDHWGYANKADNAQQGSTIDHVYANGEYTISGRNPSIEYCKQGSLYRVNYPTGGYSQFDFELHQAGNSGAPLYIQKNKSAGFTISHMDCLTGGISDLDETLNYELVSSDGIQYKLYYQTFKVEGNPRTQGQDQVNITISGMPNTQGMAINGCFGFYIKNTSNGSKVSVSSSSGSSTDMTRNATYTAFLQTGTYRLYHFPCPAVLKASNSDSYKTARYQALVQWTETHPDTQGSNVNVGGLRIKKISTIDSVNNKKLIKTYDYNEFGSSTSSGRLMSAPCYMRDYSLLDAVRCNYKLISTSSYYPLSTTNGSYVGYEQVTETSLNSQGASLGKTEYLYSRMYRPNTIDFPPLSVIDKSFPVTPIPDYDWCRGLLVEKTDYVAGSTSYVQKTSNSYSYQVEGSISGYVADYSARATASQLPIHEIQRANYTIPRGYASLNSTVIVENRNGTSVSKTTEFAYNTTSLLPVRIIEDAGNGDKMHKYISYTQDYASSGFITDLKNKHIMNRQIEEVSAFVAGTGAVQVLGGKVSTYYANGMPQNEYMLETDARIPYGSFKFSARVTGVLPNGGTPAAFGTDSRYKLRSTYNFCTINGRARLSEVTTDGLRTSYLWGYKAMYPVAKVSVAAYSDIKAKLSAAEITSVEAGSGTDAQMQTALNKIRTAYASNNDVHVYTYTYSPLEGLLSETSSAALITNYQYDTFGRVLRVKDHNGYILKEHKYKFK